MGREAQKKREEEAAAAVEAEAPDETPKDGEQPEEGEAQPQALNIDPTLLSMAMQPGMTAMEDRRYLVQTLAVGKKDSSGLREITVPVSPVKTITLVLAEDLQEHLRKQLSGGVEIADLSDIAAEAEKARKAAEDEGELKT